MTLETVIADTPACAATVRIVALPLSRRFRSRISDAAPFPERLNARVANLELECTGKHLGDADATMIDDEVGAA